MAWYTIKTSAIIAPLKLVMPGIAVSLIGGTLGVLLFNNPGKIKGRSTQDAWHSVIQYEKIYDDNIITTTRYADFETLEGLKKYKGDVMHQVQMLSENFKNVKEEKNLDNRLFAIINCKVDTYNQIHKLTDLYMDSLLKLAADPTTYIPVENDNDSSYMKKLEERSFNIMIDYNRQKQHLIDRDSSTINSILDQLNESYTKPLYKYHFTGRLPGEFKMNRTKLQGSWNFLLIGGGFTFHTDNSGTLTLDGFTRNGFWTFDEKYQFQLTTLSKDSVFTFTVLNVTNRNIRLAINDSIQIIGYRQNDSMIK